MGVKRREQDLARFEALVVCAKVFFFFFFSRETMTELSVGVFVLDILINFFFIHLWTKRAHDTVSLPRSRSLFVALKRATPSKVQG